MWEHLDASLCFTMSVTRLDANWRILSEEFVRVGIAKKDRLVGLDHRPEMHA